MEHRRGGSIYTGHVDWFVVSLNPLSLLELQFYEGLGRIIMGFILTV